MSVNGDPRTQELLYRDDPGPAQQVTNYQIRYFLAGVEAPPYNLTNARAKMISTDPPKMGEWIAFELSVRRDFKELWGVVPENYDFIRVFYEARWDHKERGAPVHAVVYYDDLFFGFDD